MKHRELTSQWASSSHLCSQNLTPWQWKTDPKYWVAAHLDSEELHAATLKVCHKFIAEEIWNQSH